MLLVKKGFPEEGELVLCTVTKIFHHSVFAELDEYKKTGLIHISEVSPGRIRNLRDFVKEGKKVVCVVLSINQEKGHIDLSLRRVNENQRRKKNEEIKQEQTAEKIVEFAANKDHKEFKDVYKNVFEKVSKQYEDLHTCFQEVTNNEFSLADLGIDKKLAKELEELIKQRMRPPEVFIKGKFTISTYEPEGVEVIKKALIKGEAVAEDVDIRYMGAGIYSLLIKDSNYKDAEKKLDKIVSTVTSMIEKGKGQASFVREET